MSKKDYILFLADTNLVLSQRLGEWCGHGPVLEQDIAMTNLSLDCIGQATLLYKYICELEGNQLNENDLAFLRSEREFKNLLLAEQPNKDFGYTVARQFLIDAFLLPLFQYIEKQNDQGLAEIASKAVKELQYHYRWSSEWIIRLGDGTLESHQRIQTALNDLWEFTGEMFKYSDFENEMVREKLIPPSDELLTTWNYHINSVLNEATLVRPKDGWFQDGGKRGIHTESLGYLLADMQFMQRSYPGLDW